MNNRFINFARFCILAFTLLVAPELIAQKTITGVVTDGTVNEPLIGGNVTVKGKTVGTVTDINGKFNIVASPSDVLIFSYIGMESKQVPVENKTVINLTLNSNAQQLSEVVAIGYGVVKKSDLTGSVAVVSTKDLTKNPSASAAQALQGKAPGVLVSQSGKPGGGATIRVRGVGSISKSADPIFILDGVQVSNIDGLQPSDIETLQVLKDASATAIYGANGSNGVIIVTTKRGKSGKPQVNLSSFVSMNLAPTQYDIMNADEYSTFYKNINKENLDPTKYNPWNTYDPILREKYYGAGWQEGTNWQDQIFHNGMSQNHNLSVAGGGENSNFNLSLGYTKDDGTVIKTNSERYNIRANSDFKLSKYIKIGENLNANYAVNEDPIAIQSSIWDLNTSPLMKINNSNFKGGYEDCLVNYNLDANGALVQSFSPTGPYLFNNTYGNDKPNLLTSIMNGSNKNYNMGLNASVYAQIDFTDWLMYKITPSVEFQHVRTRYWLPTYESSRPNTGAKLTEGYTERINLNLENQLLFKKKFNDVHNVQATVVYQVRSNVETLINGTQIGFDFEQLPTLTNGGAPVGDVTTPAVLSGRINDYRMLSYLGRIMYDYKGKYFLTGSYRSDGVSVFAPDFRRGDFFSGSLAWKVNEDFFQDVKELDALKLRVGWGQTGNSNIGEGFQYLDVISNANEFSPVFGADQNIARAQYVFNGYASKEIHWESAEMFNGGIDISLFNSKLQASAEYYVKNNNDLLVRIPISSAYGRIGGNPWYNAGKIQNRGVELSLQWRETIKDFSYGIVSSFTSIKNDVLSLPVTDITSTNNRTIVGHSIGALYGYAADGIIQTSDFTGGKNADGIYTGYKYATHLGNTPQPGDIKYKDLTGDGNVNALDKTIIGKTIPSLTYTVGFDCAYKGFDFNVFLFGVSDFQIFNQQRASLSSMNTGDKDHNKLNDFASNYWTEANASTTQVRVDTKNSNFNDQLSSFWVEDGSFLRIKDLQIGYALPKTICTKLGLGSVRFYANASNLYCFTSYKGRDPEAFMTSTDPTSVGVDYGGYTVPKTFTGGLQIGF